MSKRRIVSDTGPLITLEKLPDGYRFIRSLYDTILVPPAVLDELAQGYFAGTEAYIAHYGISDLVEVVEVKTENPLTEIELGILDKGEQEAILLALIRNLPLLIEEEAGRRVAKQLGIRISGIAGQVLQAFENHYIDKSEAERKLDDLHDAGRINKEIYQGLLKVIRENA